MKETLRIREFDNIIGNSDYADSFPCLPEKVFRELEDFIHEYSGNDENSDALEFMRIGYRRNIGTTISVNNYVGLIQLKSGYQLEVLPKIDMGGKDDLEKTKKIFLRMLSSMKDFPSKVFNTADLRTDRMTVYEIFINLYLGEVRRIVKHGIKSAYISCEDNLHYYKGKLAVSEHIKQNLVHAERFYMNFDEYSVNRSENRLIKSTLIKLQTISESAENQKEIRQLLLAFESVLPSDNYKRDFSKVAIDRGTKEYSNIMKWTEVFLFNKSFTTFSGSSSARALLFPMEKVFEAYIAKQLKKAFEDTTHDVSVQDKGYYLFDNPYKVFSIRPDIVITVKDNLESRKMILDTKWKRLVDQPGKNYGISQADMYQMYVYAKKYETSEVWLIYPANDEMIQNNNICFTSEDQVNVHVFFVDLTEEGIASSISELKTRILQG